jgi:predicted O-methyltransferase YrrM
MMDSLKRQIALNLTAPIRKYVSYEMERASKDVGRELQRRALESTADYVETNMRDVDSVSSTLDLLSTALERASLGGSGLILEFGVYTGRTINHIATKANQPVYGFDSFEGLPERWRDGFKKGYFGVGALPAVRPNVKLIKGWFDQTLPPFVQAHPEPVVFLHVDCDLYSSTKVIFETLHAQLRPGCVIVFDEYFNYPGWEEGEYKAFQEFLAKSGLAYQYIGYNRRHEQVAVQLLAGDAIKA